MTTSPKSGDLPLFYRKPEALSHARHGKLRLRDGNMAFAAETPFVPVMVTEFALASRDYPLLFTAAAAAPIVLTGLRKQNLFVKDGEWEAETYIPAYVRRYPFTTLRLEDEKGFAMIADMDSERLTEKEDEGIALFDGEKPSDFTGQIMQFCEQFHHDALLTEAFSKALMEREGLLIERRADITLPNGEKMGIDGFRVINPEAFNALEDSVVLDWHSKGWLALVHFHLASLDRFQNLMKRAQATEVSA